MRGPHEDPMAELKEQVVEALQAAYPYLTNDQLSVLCHATGVSICEAFPWHSDSAASGVITQLAA